jgi:hypothetical protein
VERRVQVLSAMDRMSGSGFSPSRVDILNLGHPIIHCTIFDAHQDAVRAKRKAKMRQSSVHVGRLSTKISIAVDALGNPARIIQWQVKSPISGRQRA